MNMEKQWKYLESKRSAHFRGAQTKRFKEMFPKGHQTSLRPFLRGIKMGIENWIQFPEAARLLLRDMHPAAYDILVENGVDYTPLQMDTAPPEPSPRSCFKNSVLLTRAKGFVYVEGVVLGSLVTPMLHAWNAEGLRETIAIDWTHYPVCRWSRYLGIPFTRAQYMTIQRAGRTDGLCTPIFHKKHFTPEREHTLRSILGKRKEAN